MLKNKFILKIFYPLLGIFFSFIVPVILAKTFWGHVPRPLDFILFFGLIPLGASLSAYLVNHLWGLLLFSIYWLHSSFWIADILIRFNQLAYNDVDRLGFDIGMINVIIAVISILVYGTIASMKNRPQH